MLQRSRSGRASGRARRARPGRRAPRVPWTLLGPAFVAGVAYLDPGNVATNTAAGSRFGYLLVWVVVAANVLAMLIQYLSAKLGIATGKSLARLCRERYSRPATWALWVQAEAVAVATDLAEVLGGAIALGLLFGVPLLVGGLVTGAASVVILMVQRPGAQRHFERLIMLLLAVVVFGFVWSAVVAEPDPARILGGLRPQFDGTDSVLLAVGMLGATVMPHAIYLHSASIPHRFGAQGLSRPHRRRTLLQATRLDVLLAMSIAGAVNLAILLLAAAQLSGQGVDTLVEAHRGLGQALGPVVALLFAVALLTSGLASSSVGTYAGAVILEGFMNKALALPLRRLLTLTPAIAILALGVNPTSALVLSQVVLSFGIPFALFPLVRLTGDRRLMGELANRRLTTVAGTVVAITVSILNALLILLTLLSGNP